MLGRTSGVGTSVAGGAGRVCRPSLAESYAQRSDGGDHLSSSCALIRAYVCSSSMKALARFAPARLTPRKLVSARLSPARFNTQPVAKERDSRGRKRSSYLAAFLVLLIKSAVEDEASLWLTLWMKRSPKPEYFVMIPRSDGQAFPKTAFVALQNRVACCAESQSHASVVRHDLVPAARRTRSFPTASLVELWPVSRGPRRLDLRSLGPTDGGSFHVEHVAHAGRGPVDGSWAGGRQM